jgi:diguanylate cyclase (GGDEF)-like protein
MKVLVADDDPVSRLVLQTAVEGLGHEPIAAEDGRAAWGCFNQNKPEVLITDLVMPALDGLELCRRVRADGRAGYTYIILATALGKREDVLRGMEAGADDYLVKPIDPFDLRSRLIAAQRVTDLHAELVRRQAELAHLARHDPLTKLGNRGSLDEDLKLLDARSQRYGHRYCLAICDIDRFKAYNDAHGHQAGDEALVAVATTMAREVRAGDGVYRYGGEEFVLVLPEQTLVTGLVAVERVRAAVQRLAVPHVAGPGGVLTLSAGIAAFDPGRATVATELLRRADVALYRAKLAGRNRVVLADDEPR